MVRTFAVANGICIFAGFSPIKVSRFLIANIFGCNPNSKLLGGLFGVP